MLHDVFICHASEDKEDFVRPLAEALRAHHLDVWFDEFALTIGDSLREAIDRGLATSQFGIVVLSPHFFHKRWTQRELSGLVAREIAEDRRLVLPIWHRIDRDEILRHSPPLADVFAVSSARGMDEVIVELLKRVRPEESPLIVARDFLISMGIDPPIVSDEWWLDVVELKEAQLRFPEPGMRRWIFPLPFPEADIGMKRGMNIAWTALQLDWAYDGEERNLCQITHPERVHEFLRKWPGLIDCARANPGVLAMYAPQLTIPGYDDGLADVLIPSSIPPEPTHMKRQDMMNQRRLTGELPFVENSSRGGIRCSETMPRGNSPAHSCTLTIVIIHAIDSTPSSVRFGC